MKVCNWVLFVILLVIFGCTEPENKDTIDITIEMIEGSTIGSGGALTMTIFGYDANIADQAATPLYKESKEINKLPFIWEVIIDEKWNQKIEPNSGTKSKFGFYIALESKHFRIDYKNTNDGDGPKFVNNVRDLEQVLIIEEMSVQ